MSTPRPGVRARRAGVPIALATVLALVLAGCAGADDPDAGTDTDTDTEEGEEEDDAGDDAGDDASPDADDTDGDDGEAADDAPGTGTDDTAGDDVRSAPDPDDPDCSAHGESVTVRDAGDVPAEVVAARDFLIDAALRCDEQLLMTAIEESGQFTYSFADEGDAIGYWWDLEEAGEAPFLRLAQVLATTPAIADGGEVVVFPRVTTGRAEDTTDEAWAELDWVDDLDAVAGTGEGYLGWRAGISLDGEWRFFVSGD